jgi:hypothetical protein
VRDQTFLPPRVLQAVGLILLLAFAAFWAVTDRESVLLVGAAGSLILLGGYERTRMAMQDMLPTKQQPPDREGS